MTPAFTGIETRTARMSQLAVTWGKILPREGRFLLHFREAGPQVQPPAGRRLFGECIRGGAAESWAKPNAPGP